MDNIKNFNSEAAYYAEGMPTTESRVSHIDETNEPKFDGVNVLTEHPRFGDAIYKDSDGGKHAICQDTYNASLVSSGWVYEGVFLGYYKDGRWRVFKGNYSSLPLLKYADVVQFRVAVPAETGTLTLGAQFITAGTTDTISVEYTEGMTLGTAENTYEQNDTTLCGRINTALANLSGITGDWWAYVNGSGEVILQRDTWTDSRQHTCSGALTHITWGDMPANSSYRKANGQSTSYRGLMNITGAAAYWATSSTRELSANVAVHSEAGNTDPMKKTDFFNSEYAADLRAYYKTYENYLRGEFGILSSQKTGAFALPDGEYLTQKYGPMMAPTKSGGIKAKFPSLNWAYLQGGHLWDVTEGVLMMEDDNLNTINATQRKAGKVTLASSATRWFAQRYNVYSAWLFNGTGRSLGSSYVYPTYQVGAVTLL